MSSTFCCQGSTKLKGVPPRWRWVIKCFYNIEHQTQNLYQHSGKTSARTRKGLHIKNDGQLVKSALDVEPIKLDLEPIKTSRTLLVFVLCFSASIVANSARANSIVSFNKLTTPSLHDVEGSLWPEELIKPEAKFNKGSEAEQKVFVSPPLQFAPLKSCIIFAATTVDGCIFEVKLSINRRGYGRSGLWLRWAAQQTHSISEL